MEGHRGSSQVGSGGARAGKPPSPASWGSRGGLGAMSLAMSICAWIVLVGTSFLGLSYCSSPAAESGEFYEIPQC